MAKKEKQRKPLALFDILNDNDNSCSNISDSNNNTSVTNNRNKVRKSAQPANRKVDSDTTKIANKSSKRNKSVADKNESKQSTRNIKSDKSKDCEIDKPSLKVGRKDRKHNWWPNCDYIWVDGIDHWVSKTAFRNDGKGTPEYTIHNYVQGLDSFWVLKYKPKMSISKYDEILNSACEELGKKYNSWEELSKNIKLNEKFLTKYKNYIRWSIFINECKKNNREFSNKFIKKFSDKFSMVEFLK